MAEQLRLGLPIDGAVVRREFENELARIGGTVTWDQPLVGDDEFVVDVELAYVDPVTIGVWVLGGVVSGVSGTACNHVVSQVWARLRHRSDSDTDRDVLVRAMLEREPLVEDWREAPGHR